MKSPITACMQVESIYLKVQTWKYKPESLPDKTVRVSNKSEAKKCRRISAEASVAIQTINACN
jgi:hypothetical protein